MKRRDVRFESDPTLDHVEVVVRGPEQNDEVLSLMERLLETPEDLTVFDGSGRFRTLAAEDVVSVAVEGKQVRVLTAEGSWYSRRTLQSMETALSGRRFVRVSRHELVNLDKVLRYDFTMVGALRLELAGGGETWASRRCIPDIRKRLQGRE